MSSYESKLRFVTKLQFAKVNRSSFYMDRYVLWVPNMLGLLLKYLETAGRLLLEKFLALLFYSFVCFAGSAFVARADIVALNFPVGYVGQFVGGSSAAKDPSNNKTLQELGFSYFAIQQDSDATMDVNGVIYPAFTSISTTAPLQGNDTRLAVYGVYSNGTRTSLFYPVLNFTFNQKKTFGLFLKPAKADPTGYYSTFSTFNPSNEDVDEGISYALVDAIYTVGHGSTFDINIDGNLTNSANNPNEDDLNAYLRSLYEDNLIPAGPVEVSAQKICATDASFDLTGIATIANGESLTVSFEGSNYYYGVTDQNDTITVSGDGWTIPGLEVPSEGDFDVAAKISNATGYLIVDGSSLEISVSNTHCFVPNPALTVVKTSTGTDLTVAGGETVWNPTDTISYKVAVTNSGNVSLGTVELSDPLASGSSIPFTTDSNVTEATLVIDDNILQPGETWEYTYDYAVTQDNINAGKVLNTAVVTSKDNDDVTVTGKSDADLDAGVDADNTGDTDDDPLVVTLDKTAALTVANDDESFGNILGESVAIVVLDNDDYEVTSPIVKLLEDSVEKTELVVVGEGKWTVSENENTVTFTPESDFFGDPTVVSYLITDSKGSKSNAATITIDYKGVANSDDLVAADDQLIGQPKGVPVSLYPLLNDANGSPDTLDTSTLRLLDKDNNIVDSNEVVVAGEGKWNVYPETGRVTFTPEPGFSGSSVSITYVVESLDGIKQTAVMKILFIDPRGVVYDDSTLQPISGVTLQFKRADGTVPEASCFENGQQPQTTGSDGRYQFDIAVNCINPVTGSSEEFQIEITDTPGYLTDPSTNGKETNPLPYDPETNLSDTLEVVTYDRAPFVGETRKFYTSFFIGTNSKQIVNNHIPLVRLSKLIEDDLRNVLRDDLIATMTQQSRQMAGYAEGALQRLKDNTDNSCSAAIADQLEYNPVMFETALARIIPESAATLDAVANLLAQCSDTAFDVEGHTDSRGDDADNVVLSNARATAVVNALRQRGIPVEQLSAVGYGESRPIADNATPEGQALNRRVVFTVFDHDLSNASCNENSILERSMDVKVDQDGATVDGKYSKESRNCTANSWTTWEGAATFLKTDTGMSQGMLNITRRQEWLLDNDRLSGYFLGAYASNNDITGLATGSIKGFGLTAGGYGAQRISGGSYLDYYLGASTGRHNFDLDFDRVDGAINADGHYDYLAAFAGLSFSGETKVGDYKIVPRAGFEAAWSPGGQADYVASREAISDASSLDTGSVSGGRLYGEVRFDDLAPNEPYQLAFKPKLFCDQPLGGGDGICGMGASIELSSTAIDGKGLFTFEIEAEQTRDSRFWGLSFDYSLPVWAGELNIINTLSNQGKLALGLNYERAF